MKVNPDAAGFDGGRLARIDEHLRTRYLEPGKIAGCQVVVARSDQVAHHSSLGLMDRERERPVLDDTIWRLYSMTKPITGAALLTLYERGLFQLNDPIDRFLPEFRDTQVIERLDDGTKRLVDPERPMSVRDAMMHMTGIGYGPPEARLDMATIAGGKRASGLGKGATLETLIAALAKEPLRFHPGTHWLYSWSTDVCARLVEVLSGERFDQYLQAAILDPLGMVDTAFCVPEEKAERLAALYSRGSNKQLTLLDDPETSRSLRMPSLLLGGGGLLGTTADYLRFCQMLVNGGQLGGTRVLGRKTIELMTREPPARRRDAARLRVPRWLRRGRLRRHGLRAHRRRQRRAGRDRRRGLSRRVHVGRGCLDPVLDRSDRGPRRDLHDPARFRPVRSTSGAS